MTIMGNTHIIYERVIAMKEKAGSEQKVCGNCIYFFQHYFKDEDGYTATIFGHCGYPRIKIRKEKDTCSHWRAAPEET